ncbi:MAG: hypothetical protein ACJA1L_003282 [Paracoccaceae bacterium]|jgi:hypothetical protein
MADGAYVGYQAFAQQEFHKLYGRRWTLNIIDEDFYPVAGPDGMVWSVRSEWVSTRARGSVPPLRRARHDCWLVLAMFNAARPIDRREAIEAIIAGIEVKKGRGAT